MSLPTANKSGLQLTPGEAHQASPQQQCHSTLCQLETEHASDMHQLPPTALSAELHAPASWAGQCIAMPKTREQRTQTRLGACPSYSLTYIQAPLEKLRSGVGFGPFAAVVLTCLQQTWPAERRTSAATAGVRMMATRISDEDMQLLREVSARVSAGAGPRASRRRQPDCTTACCR